MARTVIGPATCAVVVEPSCGEGGKTTPPRRYSCALRAPVTNSARLLSSTRYNAVLAARAMPGAHEASGVTPDIMTLAKPLRLTACPSVPSWMTDEVAAAVGYGEHGSTSAGGRWSVAPRIVVFDRIA
ncbi:MAG: aminotransferase class III-fold pyridoxal phosphate-dependent enzyme [Candidatus Promineofilum sp.]|nr:aminotransferase class III-fold pyridoxal phosphate-dependent enzyme [Promineifilum sp.]